MTQRPIRMIPDPVLRQVCDAVTRFDDALRALAQDMLDTMYAASGRGLAAPQVGVTGRIFVMDADWKEGTPQAQIFVNPVIVSTAVDEVMREEACLSIPDQAVFVARPAEVTLRWQDLDGASQSGSFAGFQATCVQHEIDHLNGVLCIDHPLAT